MKHKILLSVLLLCCGNVFSQTSNDKITYLDSLDNPASDTNFKYKRIVKDYYTESEFYEVMEYYKSGNIRAVIISSDKNEIIPNGMSKHYYENGNLKGLYNYSKLTPVNKQFEWHENGQKKFEIETSFNEKENKYTARYLQFWDKNGTQKIINGNGEFEEENKNESRKGLYLNGYPNGTWIGIDKINKFTYTERYKDGKLIFGKSTDSIGISHDYITVFKKAEPKKGEQNFNFDVLNYIPARIKKVDEATEFYRFIISPQGKITNIDMSEIKREKDKKSIIKFLNKYNEWTPCLLRGVAIPYHIGYGMPCRRTSFDKTVIINH